jgi:hypothetical protein
MKAWHLLLPLLAMTSMAFAFEKREHDAATSELKTARAASSGPSLQRGGSTAPSGDPSRPRPATTAAMRDQYERVFESEGRDAAWADSSERLAGDRLRALLPSTSAVRAVECRTSMCRFETSHADRSIYQAFLHSAFQGPSPGVWNASQFSTLLVPQTANGPLLVVSYLAREGRSLPALD